MEITEIIRLTIGGVLLILVIVMAMRFIRWFIKAMHNKK